MTIRVPQERMRLAGLMVLALLIGGCSSSGLQNLAKGNPQSESVWEQPGERISIPFDWHDGHLIIPVRVNGSDRLRFAFDTGAAATVVFETARTQSLGLDVERAIKLGETGDAPGVPVNIVNNASVSLDGLGLTGMTILHVPLTGNQLFGGPDEAYFDGAIGYDLLRRFVTEIDYVRKTISFSRAPATRAFAAPWQAVPIDLSRGVPVSAVQLESQVAGRESVALIIDTGAPSYLYLNPDLTRGVVVPERSYPEASNTFYGPVERTVGRVKTFSIGPFTFDNQLAHFDQADFKDLGPAIGLIGNGVLRNFDLVLDYSTQTMWMRPNAGFEPSSPADRSGISLKPHRLGGVAQWVAAGSAAGEIGLASGDVVTRLGGASVEQGNFDAAKKLLSSDREAVDICWQAGAKTVCERLRLTDRM